MTQMLVVKNIMKPIPNANGTEVLVMVKQKELRHAEFIQLYLELNMDALVRNKKYLAKEIIGVEVWASLEKGEQLQVGRDMACMAERKLIPLSPAGRDSANSLIYTVDKQSNTAFSKVTDFNTPILKGYLT